MYVEIEGELIEWYSEYNPSLPRFWQDYFCSGIVAIDLRLGSLVEGLELCK